MGASITFEGDCPAGFPRPDISVIIPVRNDATRLAACLRSVRANLPGPSLELIVVDNGSEDDSVEVARAAGARVLQVPGRPVAELRNRAARAAAGRVLAFIDADHSIDSRWFATALETLEQSGAAGVGAHYSKPAVTWVQRAYDLFRERPAAACEVNWLASGNLAITRDAFLAVGGFDEGLEACEDVDLCNRLRSGGHRLVCDPRLRSTHYGDPATLGALFAGELWRGRDNIRVTLRGPLTLRAVPSLLWPVIDLLLMAAALVGIVTTSYGGLRLTLAATLGMVSLSALRAFRMARHAGDWRVVPGTLAVAGVYDLARACALVVRASHRTRRGK